MSITAHLISAGPEDDAAIESLHDISRILGEHPNTSIVGGHMVSVLAAAFPSPGFIERHTGDTDAGIPVELASSGQLHEALTAAAYVADSGNRYVKPTSQDPKPTIDLLIPSLTGRFHPQVHGERAFDAAPGLTVALHSTFSVHVQTTNRALEEHEFDITVPTVEAAIILKAHAWASRRSQKDVIDISNLLHIVDEHGSDAVGGWQLAEPELIGSRRDAARHLYALAQVAEARRLPVSQVNPRKLVVLIRRYITAPS
jgi:hypothetical protein